MQTRVPLSCSLTPSPSKLCPHFRTICASFSSNGSPNMTCPTTPVSKNVKGRMPLVLSMIWSGMKKSRGWISSCKLPTAEKAIMVRTPIDLRAAIFARELTSWGANSWWTPWRLRKATLCPGRVDVQRSLLDEIRKLLEACACNDADSYGACHNRRVSRGAERVHWA